MAALVQGNVTVAINTGTPEAPIWTNIPGVTTASYSGSAPREIDATDFDTPVGESETLYGAKPNSPLTFQMHLDPGNVTQELLWTASAAGDDDVQVRLKGKTKGTTFTGRVVIGESHAVDGKLMSDVSILPVAAPLRATIA
ncbi:hypothetical protein D3C71_271620 [compost metagenome]